MKEIKWNYHSPKFECDTYNLEMMKYSPWSGHRLFAYDYICSMKPDRIVELGSYYGCSAFSFLQALKDNNMQSAFWAVDTWEGDSFTENDYTENIYQAYREIQNKCFEKQNAHMLRMTFDEAYEKFEDHTIDLLHIDGSHTYEDVKHDFLKWKDRVRQDGVIFFHDVGEDDLYGKKMGSHIFWEELKKEYPNTLEFPFSFGLGILFFDKDRFEDFKKAVDFNYYQRKANMAAAEFKDTLRKDFFRLRDQEKYIESLKEQEEINQQHLHRYEANTAQKDQYILELQGKIEELNETCKNLFSDMKKSSSQYEQDLKEYQKGVEEKEAYIGELLETIKKYTDTDSEKTAYIEELCGTIEKYQRNTEGKDSYIEELKKALLDYQRNVQDKDTYVRSLEAEKKTLTEQCAETYETLQKNNTEYAKNIELFQKDIAGKDSYIRELQDTILKYEETVKGKDTYIKENEQLIRKYEETSAQKDEYIASLNETIEKYKSTVDGKDRYLKELSETIQKYEETVKGKDAYIGELSETIQKYKDTVDGKDRYISELEKEQKDKEALISKLKEELTDKEKLISELTGQNAVLEETIAHIPLGKYVRKRMEGKSE